MGLLKGEVEKYDSGIKKTIDDGIIVPSPEKYGNRLAQKKILNKLYKEGKLIEDDKPGSRGKER